MALNLAGRKAIGSPESFSDVTLPCGRRLSFWATLTLLRRTFGMLLLRSRSTDVGTILVKATGCTLCHRT